MRWTFISKFHFSSKHWSTQFWPFSALGLQLDQRFKNLLDSFRLGGLLERFLDLPCTAHVQLVAFFPGEPFRYRIFIVPNRSWPPPGAIWRQFVTSAFATTSKLFQNVIISLPNWSIHAAVTSPKATQQGLWLANVVIFTNSVSIPYWTFRISIWNIKYIINLTRIYICTTFITISHGLQNILIVSEKLNVRHRSIQNGCRRNCCSHEPVNLCLHQTIQLR